MPDHSRSGVTARTTRLMTVAVVALGVVGCGNGGAGGGKPAQPTTSAATPAPSLPDGVIAEFDGVPITKAEYEARERVALYEATVRILGPDAYRRGDLRLLPIKGPADRCADAIRRRSSAAARDRASDDERRGSCVAARGALEREVVNQLLAERVTAAEAPSLGAKTGRAALRQRLRLAYRPFGGRGRIEAFTDATGISDRDLRDRQEKLALSQEVRRKAVERAGPPNEADMRKYYREAGGQLTTPERRDVRVVRAATRSEADGARRRIEAGESFEQVARAVSTDEASRKRGGLYLGAVASDLPDGVGRAAFATTEGTLAGPIAVPGGWAILRVDRIIPAVPLSFEQAKARIRQVLPTYKPIWAWAEYQESALRRWRPKIVCAEGYGIVALCGNRSLEELAREDEARAKELPAPPGLPARATGELATQREPA